MLHKWAFLVLVLFLPTQLGLHFWPDFAYVFGIRVDYFSPTIYLSDIVFLLLFVFWVFSGKNIPRPNFPSLVIGLGLFLYLAAASLFIAQNQGAALYKLAKFIQMSLLLLYAYKNRHWILAWRPFYTTLALSVIYSSLVVFFQFINQKSLGGIFWWLGERSFSSTTPGIALASIGSQEFLRPYGTFSHPNSLAGFVLVVLILLAPWRTWLARMALVLGSGAVFISFSQAAWLTGFFLGILYLTKGSHLWSRRFLLATVFVVFLVSFSLLFIRPPAFVANQEIRQRWELGALAQKMTRESPLVGVGLNNFVVRLPEFSQTSRLSWWLQPVHNILLLLLVETGLVGVVIFLYLGIRFLGHVFLDGNEKDAFLLLAVFLTGTLDHYWLTLEQNQLLLALVLGIVAHSNKKG